MKRDPQTKYGVDNPSRKSNGYMLECKKTKQKNGSTQEVQVKELFERKHYKY